MSTIYLWPDEFGPSETKGDPSNTATSTPIADAVSSASDQDTLWFNRGTYDETGEVALGSKRLKFFGPNKDVDPNEFQRRPEAVISAALFTMDSNIDFGNAFEVNGLKFTGHISGDRWEFGQSGPNAAGNVVFRHCVFDDPTDPSGFNNALRQAGTGGSKDLPEWLIERCRFLNVGFPNSNSTNACLAVFGGSLLATVRECHFIGIYEGVNITTCEPGTAVKDCYFKDVVNDSVRNVAGQIEVRGCKFEDAPQLIEIEASGNNPPSDLTVVENNDYVLDVGRMFEKLYALRILDAKRLRVRNNRFKYTGDFGTNPLDGKSNSATRTGCALLAGPDTRSFVFEGNVCDASEMKSVQDSPVNTTMALIASDDGNGRVVPADAEFAVRNNDVYGIDGVNVYDFNNGQFGNLDSTVTIDLTDNNFLTGVPWGVRTDSPVVADARNSAWGDLGSQDQKPSGGVSDPFTGETADGSGSAVSGSVQFDPWGFNVYFPDQGPLTFLNQDYVQVRNQTPKAVTINVYEENSGYNAEINLPPFGSSPVLHRRQVPERTRFLERSGVVSISSSQEEI